MFPLEGSDVPRTGDEFSAALTSGLARLVRLPPRPVVTLEGPFPDLTALVVDLSGARVDPAQLLPRPAGTGQTQPGMHTDRLEVHAAPLLYRNSPVHGHLAATAVQLAYDRDPAGQLVLIPVTAQGQFHGRIAQADLEDLLLAEAREAARRQGIEIQRTDLTLAQRDERSLQVAVRVQAAKRVGILPVTGVLHLTGTLVVDAELVATVSGLSCRGEGMVGGMVAPLLQGQLRALEGFRLPLAALPLGGLRCHDVRIRVSGTDLELTAALGV